MKQKLLLILILIASIVPLPTLARDFTYEYEGQTLTYTVIDEEAKTCETKAGSHPDAGNKISGQLSIPDIAEDKSGNKYTVTTISECAFKGCFGLTSVTIPNSVISIGSYAFQYCSGLTSVTIGNSVTEIGERAFQGCSGLTSVTIGNSVTKIGYLAFSGCYQLISITIPNSVTSIGSSAFAGCSGLTSIIIPNSVTEIVSGTFSGCSGLKELTIEDGTETLSLDYDYINSSGMFYDCPLEILYLGRNLSYNSSYPPFRIKNEKALKSVTIGNSVTEIGNHAFEYCSGLTSVTIGNSVTEIGESAFEDCSGLTSVTFGNSVTEIGERAFYGCDGLKEIHISSLESWCKINFTSSVSNPLNCTHNLYLNGELITDLYIPESVSEIKKYAFWGCSGLTSVTIPNSVTKIGDHAFDDCDGLKYVRISSLESWCKINFGNWSSNPLSYAHNLYLNGELVKDLVIPETISGIKQYAFEDCSGLTSVTIPNSVTSIGESAFAWCSGLTSVTIPNSITVIGWGAFYGCSGLTSITIPDSVTKIGDYAFRDCSGLTSVTIPNSVTEIGEWAFSGCSELTSFTIPNSVTVIGWGAFDGCSGLTSITIPNSITEIGYTTFDECSGLKSVTIGNSVTEIGEYAFRECSGLTSITIPNSVTEIGYGAFKDCSGLIYVKIGNSVTEIDEYAFATESIKNIEVLNPVPPSLPDDVFPSEVYRGATLRVPVESVEAYKAADGWKRFYQICGFDGVESEAIEITIADIELVEGETSTLIVTITPENATDKSVTWSSSDETVASVDASGLVTALKAGTATITATTSNGFTASCTVTVKAKSAGIDGVESEGESAVRVEGGNIIAPDGSEVFDLNGRRVSATSLRPGIYIVRIPGGKAVKIRVK